ncbi:unnamed protein product [Pleuronectes platessa]|uniref:Uncharacterized protein n=1 Tax=Pleuronectes platessa TaxID=8262 RepID=A0A9N7Z6Y4_PLEPL|nr:unnamed protein product [Pleuronectes platessa]
MGFQDLLINSLLKGGNDGAGTEVQTVLPPKRAARLLRVGSPLPGPHYSSHYHLLTPLHHQAGGRLCPAASGLPHDTAESAKTSQRPNPPRLPLLLQPLLRDSTGPLLKHKHL